MEIVVRKNDLLRELQLVQGIVERKNSIPDPFQRPRRDERRRDSHRGHGPRRLAPQRMCRPGRLAGSDHPRSQEAVRDHALLARERRAARGASRLVDGDRMRAGALSDGRPPTRGLSEPPRGEGRAGHRGSGSMPFGSLIARTAFAITAEDARYYLAGALLILEKDAVSMVATDGHRLSYASRKVALKVTEGQRVLVPRKAIQELARLLETGDSATFQQVENHLVFSVGSRTLASKSIEGQFPAFEKVIAITGDKSVRLSREALATAIRRVSLLSSDRSRAIKLSLEKGHVNLAASSPDLGEARESLPVEYTGSRGRDRLQRPVPPRLSGRRRHRRGRHRAQGPREPGRLQAGGAAEGRGSRRVSLRRDADASLAAG